MPPYALICRIDDDALQALKQESKKLCLSTDTFDAIGNVKSNVLIGTATEIQSGSILYWSDTFMINTKDSNGVASESLLITYGQKFCLSAGTMSTDPDIATVTDDDASPDNGFLYRSYKDVQVTIMQEFSGGSWGRCYQGNITKDTDYTYIPSLTVGVWFGDPDTTTSDADKFHIDFSEKFGQTAYYKSDGTWSLVGPDTYSAGALLSMTQGANGFLVSQMTSQSFSDPITDPNGSRKQVTASFWPVNLTLYVDTSNYDVGLEVAVFGISVGTVHGNLENGLIMHISLLLATGTVRLHLESSDPKELWAAVNLSYVGGVQPAVNIDQKIFTF